MDKNGLKAQKAELENILNISKGIVEESEQKINKINEVLKELETFTPCISIDNFSRDEDEIKIYGKILDTRRYAEIGSPMIQHITNSVFTMIDLANWCNAWCNAQNEHVQLNVEYQLYYKYSEGVINFAKFYGASASLVSFNSLGAAKLALEQINSNPELKRLAMIFLGANDENTHL